ncbi:MAG: MFS transporter [Planctomycetota bacterium]
MIPASLPPASSLRRDLLVTTIDALAFSVMVGCGETYFSAFALALGLGPVAAGMVATVPVLVGAVVQLAAPLGVARLGSNREWVIVCTLAQACCFLPLGWWAIRGHAALWELIVAASVYWAAGMAGAPAWTAWMAGLVPDAIRTPYFAQRNRLGQLGVFLGFGVSGLMLQWGEARGAVLPTFAAMFAAAAGARRPATACRRGCREPRRPATITVPAAERPSLPRRITAAMRAMAGRRSGALVAYLCCFVFGAQIAAPSFIPYMLRELGFSYHAFMLVYGTSFLAKALLLPAIGRLASRIGPLKLLWGASFAIVPLAALWLPSAHVAYLCGVQVIAGACWAAHELGVTLAFFQDVDEGERTGVVTVSNLGVAVATVAGAACGGMLLRWLGEGWQAYATVFSLSCLARLVMIPILRIAMRRGAVVES